VEAGYGEFLKAVPSSEIVFREQVSISLYGDSCCKHVEAFADILRQSDKSFRELHLGCSTGSAIRFAKCVSSVLLGNDDIQHLNLEFRDLNEEMGKDLSMEFMTIIGVPRILRIIKSFGMDALKVDGEGMEELLKPFQSPSSVLEVLTFYSLTLDAQLEHLSGILASNTSLKTLLALEKLTCSSKGFY
jgi:hypothetical protein